MTRLRRETPPASRTTPADRMPPPARPVPAALAAVVLMLLVSLLAGASGPVRGVLAEIRIEGNASIGEDEIRRKVLSRVGRDFDPRTVDTDQKALMASGWFSDVRTFLNKTPDGKGLVLIFQVRERPVLRAVEFRGATKIKAKALQDATDLKVGGRSDHVKNMLAVNQVRQLYLEKGYEMVDIRLIEGGKAGDTRAIFQIFEGPRSRLTKIEFKGNNLLSDATLRTKLTCRVGLLGLGSRYHKDDVEEDARKLREFYQGLGYFEAKVSHVMRRGSGLGDLELEFDIWEGVQYKVRDIAFEGNEKLPTDTLLEGLVMHSGQPFSDSFREADGKNLQEKYGEIGCIDARIEPKWVYTDEPGVIDIVYRVDEGDAYTLGHFLVKGNQSTREKVLRREANMAGLVPGEPLNSKHIELYRKRVASLGYFVNSPEMGKPIEIQIVNRRPHDQPYGETAALDLNEVVRTRLQDPGPEPPLLVPPAEVEELPAPGPAVEGAEDPFDFGARGMFNPPADLPPLEVPALPGGRAPAGDPLLGPGPMRSPPLGFDEPPALEPSLPGSNMLDVGPDRQEPFVNRSFADIITMVDEAPTGRLMFGVGASSYGGLNGSMILHERNFDLFAVPRSARELFSGQAFRGAGQELRIELMPGTQINRAQVSFSDPYLFDLPIGFGAAGYAFNRVYPDFTDGRAGGRFSLGRQFGTMTYADVALRAENVHFGGFRYPAPASYLAAEGNTTLVTLRPSLRLDNRNDQFKPNKGQYLEFAFEQGWGTFTYPKASVEGRLYWTTGSRADGTGKRVFVTRGYFGATGPDTPVYERFFLGDFRSLRGFAYRGVGPRVLGVGVGGLMTAVGSVEYQFPWTANDKLYQVVFCDFGTVESGYNFTTFRASIGTGLRIFLPQQVFGPLPLAFDLAFPIAKGPDDRERIFNFNIGSVW